MMKLHTQMRMRTEYGELKLVLMDVSEQLIV